MQGTDIGCLKKRIVMLKKMCLLILIVLFVTVLLGCQSDMVINQYSDEVLLASGQTLKSEIPRGQTVDVSNNDKADLVKDNGTFAFNLYQEIRNQKSNLLFSPYGISTALSMIYTGARGNTEKGKR